ncbi:MAG: PIN domain-containing protein [Polyangia bacterium]
MFFATLGSTLWGKRFGLVLDALPDERLASFLERRRGRGRDDYPVRPMWNAVLAGVVSQHQSAASLVRELHRNGRGIELIRRRDPASAQRLEAWLTRLRRDFHDRILPVDDEVAQAWGTLGLEQPLPPIDGLLAATALIHDLVLVTKNEADVSRAPIEVVNPFR